MTTLNTKQKLMNFKGTEALKVRGVGPEEYDLEIGEAISNILLEKSANPSLSFKLGKRFALEDTVDLSLEEAIFLKETIKNTNQYGPLVSGQLLELLDPSGE